jgi:hypothetical protein
VDPENPAGSQAGIQAKALAHKDMMDAGTGQVNPEVDSKNPPGSQPEVQLKPLFLKRKKATERWLLDRVASQNLALSLSKFRATPTSIGCMPGRNQRSQCHASLREFSPFPSPAVSKP